MDPNQSDKPTCDRETVHRWLSSARISGEHDIYAGKRHTPRYAEDMALEITTDPTNPKAASSVIMHNISEYGCAFWLRRKLNVRSRIFVRETSPDGDAAWLPGCISHCTQGLRGYLIGVAFDDTPQQA